MALYLSDDDEYYDDEFEDEEIIDLTFADQLAGATSHDIVPIEDPSFETEDYFSDWDERSDDYYDDDPTIVRRRRAVGNNEPDTSNGEVAPDGSVVEKRNPKRGTSHPSPPGKVSREQPSTKTDIASFQGVVWRSSNHEPNDIVQLHEPGSGEKVALLKNWREIFKTSHPSNDRPWIRKKALGLMKSDTAVHSKAVNCANGKENLSGKMSSQTRIRSPSPVLIGRVAQSTVDLLFNPTPTEDGSPVDDYSKQYSDLSDTATPSDVPSTVQTQPSSVSSDTNMTDSADSGPDVPSVSVVIPVPSKGKKRKASVSVDVEVDEHEDAPEDIGRRKSRRIIASKEKKVGAGQTRQAQQPLSGGGRRSTRLKNGSK